ncbi:hypothetical protein A3J20_04290 [Candidatus Gottesmanbacteria bacterium RIFCSPLOWO2_02_FULL_42_29]|uniref:Peptidase M56 domain-containing protein n=2 Tax=Candidatus Gottesmaniibacteriota TaxID=1752720 RepID=A0A1F6BAM1_9BACT|nr:MAG: peptidase M56 BlaR1 [Candidatus Gottesmanbacteria bacterium GW2011_GWA2_42_18]OGG11092.1 MAG: hypothetical protein A2781_00020 [Candidatus Gottesmanbacteria bacterium RIFCSPHIGHO2_01_FULL_42_27]OGG21958.1 MAG: hypothetical protein A3E72_03500 [Candidatus Gottesmanbacteria bacterium RIFCSPHIGHO2_12_FULL_43_26]OGG33976.1 MAG: hypothetical protein A2968_05730 [Candidatus Gottesmanbacteria bacterium RIFCSPLOWO2_01_FULL_42_22]OGG38473.1 MAG: hypothetical protein A3J20_04290 [Candidatus Gotte
MRLNKYLLLFSVLFVFLLLGYSVIFFRFFPILFHHAVYFCREMIKSLSLGLPENFGSLVFAALALSVIYAILALLVSLMKILRFRKNLSPFITNNNSVYPLLKKLNLENKVIVLRNDKPVAYCFGIINPKIYISIGLLCLVNRRELKIILRHEKYHLENRDSATQLLAVLIESLFPFFPVISDLIRIYRYDREITADRQAARETREKQALSSVLTKLLRYSYAPLPGVAAISDADTLEARIKSLLKLELPAKKLPVINIFISFVSLIIFFGLTFSPAKALEYHLDNHHEKIKCSEPTYSPAYFTLLH